MELPKEVIQAINAVLAASRGKPALAGSEYAGKREIIEINRRLANLARVAHNLANKHLSLPHFLPHTRLAITLGLYNYYRPTFQLMHVGETWVELDIEPDVGHVRIPMSWLSMSARDQAKLLRHDIYVIRDISNQIHNPLNRGEWATSVAKAVETYAKSLPQALIDGVPAMVVGSPEPEGKQRG